MKRVDKYIPQIEPWIDQEEQRELMEVVESTWITEGEKSDKFAQKLKRLSGAKYAILTCNGTSGLVSSLLALELERGQEVLVPDVTFVASANSVLFAGGRPVFVDVNPKTMQMEIDGLEKYVSDKTVGIMPVHLYGSCVDMKPLMRFAKEHKLWVIEDAAQSLGVAYRKRHTGTFGECGMFSFYGNKILTTGQGGCVVTGSKKLYQKIYDLSHEGRTAGNFEAGKFGVNFKFTDTQAALGLAQMSKFNEILRRKRKVARFYRKCLKDIPEIEFPIIHPDCKPNHWFVNIFVDNVAMLERHLARCKIGTRRIFPPLHKQPYFRNDPQTKKSFPGAGWLYNHGLSLPSSATLSEGDLDRIGEAIRSFYG